jgi:rubrerythrin
VGVVNSNTDDGERSVDDAGTNTRRQFVAGSAGALGGVALGGSLVGSAVAQTDDGEDGEDGEDGGEAEEPVENEFEDDVAILNYARTLEFLEASFYAQGLENIGEEDLCSCQLFGDDDDPLREQVYAELQTIQAHEEAHVEALGAAVEELGGEPVEEPEFDFGLAVQYPVAFLATAAQLEDVGVSAYAGAAPYIENEDLVAPALGIHSVEARHASFLRTLLGDSGFPNAVDAARSRSEVEALIAPFVVGMEEPEGEDPDDGMDTPEDNGTDVPDDNGTDVPEDNGTDVPEDNGTDVPEDNGTDVPDDNGTDVPEDNGTDVPSGNGTDDNGTNTSS